MKLVSRTNTSGVRATQKRNRERNKWKRVEEIFSYYNEMLSCISEYEREGRPTDNDTSDFL